METEEIEKDVIQEFAEEYIINCGDTYFTKTTIKNAFIAGAAYANSNWQEKTKYKELSKEFPPEGKPLIFKFTENVQKVHCHLGYIGLGFILLDNGDSLSEREAKELGTLWKELE